MAIEFSFNGGPEHTPLIPYTCPRRKGRIEFGTNEPTLLRDGS